MPTWLSVCPFLMILKVKCFLDGVGHVLGTYILNSTVLVSLKELCRLESKTGVRISEPQQGTPRLVAPPHRTPSATAPTPKSSGVAESVYKSNPK